MVSGDPSGWRSYLLPDGRLQVQVIALALRAGVRDQHDGAALLGVRLAASRRQS